MPTAPEPKPLPKPMPPVAVLISPQRLDFLRTTAAESAKKLHKDGHTVAAAEVSEIAGVLSDALRHYVEVVNNG